MADIRYPISQLFKVAFGFNSPIYIPSFEHGTSPNIDYKDVQLLPDYYKADSVSWMGTPVLFSATLKGGNYFKYKNTGELDRVAMNDYTFPPATMFSFRRAKNITRTNIEGGNGTVKEIYGFDDWVIDVKGLCLDEPNRSAAEQVTELLKFESLADGINISGRLFEDHQVSRVVINDWSDNIVQGKPGVISFQCQLYSDEHVILQFLDE